MKPDIVAFTTDSQLLGLSISPAQETLLRSIYGLPLTPEQLEIYRRCTGRQSPPQRPVSEATVISGARSGKDSRVAAPVLLYEACYGEHPLARGEVGTIPLVAADLRQTRIAYTYIRDYLLGSPLLASMVAEVLASEIVLTNGLRVVCFPCVAAALRGWSIVAAAMSEAAFFAVEGMADSDVEIQTAILRGMSNLPDARLLKVSTPWRRSGVLWEDFQAFGEDDPDRLVWRSTTKEMNPHPPLLEKIARAFRRNARLAAREYEAEFIDDAATAYPGEWLDAAVVSGRRELPPRPGVSYVGATDPTGGGGDVFSLVILHREGSGSESRLVVDAVRGRSHVGAKLEALVGEYTTLLKSYHCREVYGDKYAGEWPRQEFLRRGIVYRDAPGDKSEALLGLEPLLAQGRVELVDHPELLRELRLLDRRPRAGGRTVIEAPRGAHDDYATALAHAAQVASEGGWIEGDLRQFAAFAPLTSAQLPRDVYDPALAPPWSSTAGGRTDGESPEDWARARGLNPDADAPWNIYGD